MVMKKEDLTILEKSKTDRNWTDQTLYDYKNAIKTYIKFNKKSLTELLQEAEKEELEGIRWKDRTLRTRLINFRTFLYDNYLAKTAESYLKRVRVMYKDSVIELHELPYFSDKNANHSPPIYYKNLPTHEIIRMACDISDPLMTAIILFMVSSGSAKRETLNLTIEDFINSTKIYHNIEIKKTEDVKEILNKIIKELIPLKKIIPNFEIRRQKTNNYYITHCSTEAVKAILNYLLTRTDKLTFDKRLFKISGRYFHDKFKEINEKLGLGKVSGQNRFRSHMLRKFHASNLSKSIKLPDENKQPGMDDKYVDALQGRGKLGSRKSYFFDDYESLRDEYIHFLDRVTIYPTKNLKFKTDKYLELEKELNTKMIEKDKVISNIAEENIKLKTDNEEFKSQMQLQMDQFKENFRKSQREILDEIRK
jgi:hypothetical protein